ncbi:MAG: YtxH domain-containing protein [Gracilimonas sp.]|jgi:gas vesicle protein|uniref:YtxH domain-containing protein n=1 Tax=Gracilimonas sp. TaxID=1974203 RepID=UPI0019BC4831|nr:YtxH domain-containing protein [Gracilimonas sp.]MBD3617823.1 YtxH domain-containing protein [Gracilimonas sp.]
MKRGIGTLLFGAAAFTGGIVAGLFLTPKSRKENLRWVKDQTNETKEWLESQSRKIKEDSEKRIDRFSKGIKKSLKDSLPDLYEATEDLDFTEEEEIEEITKNG